MRKAFNFFNSYWQVANELNNEDRLRFYDALFNYQFTGDKSMLEKLTGNAKFAFISQRHSIESQIKGYEDNCKKLKINPFDYPAVPPALGGSLGADEGAAIGPDAPPALQEKEEGKVKEKVKVEEKVEIKFIIPTIDDVRNYFIENNYRVDAAESFFNYYSASEWRDSKDKQVKNWKLKAKQVWFTPKNEAVRNNNGSNFKMVF